VDLIVKGTMDPGNSAAQLKLLESLVAQGVDALVVTPASPERMVAPLESLAAKGLKIVVADTDLPGNSTFPFVGYDQKKFSQAAAEAFSALVRVDDEVAIFSSSEFDQIVRQRDRFILARLMELHPRLKVHTEFMAVANEHSPMSEKADLLVKTYPDANLLIATSSHSTSILLAAVNHLGAADKIKIAGFGFTLTADTVAAIKRGTMPAFIVLLPKDIGYKSVTAAVALIRGTPVPARTDIPFQIITKDNIAAANVQLLGIEK
jgi:ABC-type sugar transport system substrate-binding protein